MKQDYQKLDKQYIWHPFTQMQDWIANEQLVIERGDGVYLYDTNGKKYIDGVSSLWVTVHSHRNKALNQAIKNQLDKIAHSTLLGLANVPSAVLAEKLIKIAPKGLTKVFYSDNGSTAVEIALKMAYQYFQLSSPLSSTSSNSFPSPSKMERGAESEGRGGVRIKTKFITLENAYHGDTVGSVSVGGIDLFHKIFKPLLFNAFQVRTNLAEVEKVMRNHHREIAAMIVEPLIQGAAGMLLQPNGFLKGVRKLCDKYNILLICDEVATGFGRTGKMFACEHENVTPDLMCVAKGLTGGYLPIAATLVKQKIFDAFLGKIEEQKTFFHGHTYTGNPLGCAAAIANLDLFKKEKTLQKLQPKIKQLTKGLEKIKKLKSVKEIRQLGFMVGIDLDEKVNMQKVMQSACQKGAILRPLGQTVVMMPPLSISQKELEKLLGITYEAIIIH